ncbi:MAG: lysophospholipase [candidate division KSB1 bacterium]|nr:lysophospholipase [candidate division KSB1 bacterium]MDZ7368421.1 lysophospholipase [candidate division KSB1 bacterium]MDZ7406003.1 lysophospholipase [candidate division KSB1 bacterium]
MPGSTPSAIASNRSKQSSPGRWLRRILMILGILIFVFIFFVVPFGFSYLLTHAGSRPSDRNITASAISSEQPFLTIAFKARDGVSLSGWYFPREEAPAAVIYCHGLFRSRLEVVDRAEKFWQGGYAGLLLDFRGHGQSGGELTSMGYLERLDIIGAVHYLSDSLQFKGPIVVYGVSMGAAAALLAAAEEPKISGLIIDSSFLSFDETITHHARNWLRLPKFPIVDELILFTQWQIGFNSEDFDLRRAVQKIGDRPILFIAGGADQRMPPQIARALYEASPSTHKTLVVIPNAPHGAAFRTDRETYTQAVLRLLQTVGDIQGLTKQQDAIH